MPLLLRSLPLSFQTFWRYLLVLPGLAIAAFVISVLSIFIPLAGIVVPGMISAFCVFVGLRCALVARGYRLTSDFQHLVYASLVFCILNMFAAFAIDLIASAAAWGMISLSPEVLSNADDPTITVTVLSIVGGVLFLKGVLIAAYSSAIAVPMTNVASGSYQDARSGVFFGFGTGAISLFLVTLIWVSGGNLFSLFGEIWTMFAMMAGALIALLSGEDIPWDWSFSLGSLMGGTLFMAWGSSWFFATAVLAWEKAGERRKAADAAAAEAQRVSSTDIRALRAQRMRSD